MKRNDDIIYVQAENKKCYVVTENGHFVQYKPLVRFVEELSEDKYIRVNRSALINMDYIETIEYNHVVLSTGIEFPISRGNYKLFADALSKYVQSKSTT